MKNLFLVISLVFLLCFALSCQKAEEVAEKPVVDVEADIQTLKNIEEEWGAALAASDFENALSFYAENAIFIPANQPPIFGKEAIRGLMRQQLDQFTMEYGGTVEDVQASEDLAFTRGTYSQTLTPKSGVDSLTPKGNWLCIYSRQSDGTWKCIINMSSDESLISPTQSK